MKTKQKLQEILDKLKSDKRLSYSPATVFGNAPLALHQTAAEAKIHLLEDILELPLSTFPLKSK